MTREKVVAAVAALIEELASIDRARVVEDASLVGDLDLDSTAVVEIAVAVEQRLGVTIPDSDIAQFKTVRDLIDYIEARGPTLRP